MKTLLKVIGIVMVMAVVAVAAINGGVMLMGNAAIATSEQAAEQAETYDCIVVLGASVYPDGTLSPILEDRVDMAVDMYFEGKAPVIIVSGDGREATYNEPAAMKAYAVAQGVPPNAVYCDGGGYHTYDTMWRVRNVYGANSALVVTQQYHLYRAVFDAQGVGMTAAGVAADQGQYDNQRWYDLREVPARLHDFAQVILRSLPDAPEAPIAL